MTKGIDIIDIAQSTLADPDMNTPTSKVISEITHSKLLEIHSRALACHCECLGMNAENSLAVCGNYSPPYNDSAYFTVMKKWGLVDKEGKPII